MGHAEAGVRGSRVSARVGAGVHAHAPPQRQLPVDTPPPGFAKEGPSIATSLPEVLAAIDRSLGATTSTPVR